jgi:dTDP-4-dehydrorhamnose reductase
VLVLGASGMLGSAVFRFFARSPGFVVQGSLRSAGALRLLSRELRGQITLTGDLQDFDTLTSLLIEVRPNVIVNCVGLVKQLADADDPLKAIPINSVLPHRLAKLAELANARLIHVSTDCVFSGKKGMYREGDPSDSEDLYGRSKYLGEVDYPNSVTLRTSIVGHELDGMHGLVNWFLAQEGEVNGFTRAIFSGLPTVEVARVIRDFIIPNPDLRGVYHLSSAPISKFDLLRMIAEKYGKIIEINADDRLVVDRSLDSSFFQTLTGYTPPPWSELVAAMREFA